MSIDIVIETDIIFRIVAQNKGAFKVTLGEIRSSLRITINKDTSLDDALSLMKRKRFNRLRMTAEALVGLLSIQRLVATMNLKTTFEVGYFSGVSYSSLCSSCGRCGPFDKTSTPLMRPFLKSGF
jgi:signal-transduction protein with cAMP-binding, CBS, and nucleotidyltransferase domain